MTAALRGARGRRFALAALLVGIVLPFVHGIYTVFATNLVCYALFAVAFDLLLGFTGLLSFGHAMFWGGAAYVTAIAVINGHFSPMLGVIAGTVYAGLAALVVGALSIRSTGIYFAMITLALAQLQYFVVFQWHDLTGGENGLQFGSRGTLAGLSLENDRVFYFVVLAIGALCFAFVLRVVSSPFGLVLTAMRDNEQRARSIGYDTARFKLIAFVMSGAMSGLAGALFALNNRLVGLDVVDWHTSGKVVMMTILGGIGTLYGAIAGAGLYESLEYFVSKTAIGDKTNIVMGTIFAIVILAGARRGIVGELLASRTPAAPAPEAEPAPLEAV
ncbi:MAG: branched-chain amino acid ABC transporter permease [Candidatus Velthaea sp.]